MVTQTRALTKIATSTWGALFAHARHVYLAVVRPAITYGSTVWYAPAGTKDARKNMAGKFEVTQYRCSRIVAGAYKATPIEVLQAETMMPRMQVHLDQLQAKARSRLKVNGQAAFIRKQCKRVAAKLRKRRVNTAPNTAGGSESSMGIYNHKRDGT